MMKRNTKKELIKTSDLYITLILLAGVLAMAYGYFSIESIYLYGGLALTLLTSTLLIFKTVLQQEAKLAIRKK